MSNRIDRVQYSIDGHRAYKTHGIVTARKVRKSRVMAGDRQPYKGPKIVAYCPVCPRNQIDPETDSHVYGPWKHNVNRVVCPKGHVFYTA